MSLGREVVQSRTIVCSAASNLLYSRDALGIFP
jgi:hypothetical protein